MGFVGLILSSAFFLALYDLAKKASVRDNAVLPVLLCSTSFGCLGFVAILAASGLLPTVVQTLDGRLVALASAKSALVATSWIFTFCALRTLPITIATPIRASAPALVVLVALVVYGEIPSAGQAAGMVCVFAGYWAFSWAGRNEGVDFFRNRAVWLAVAGACFSAFSALYDKYVFQVAGASVEGVQLVFQMGLVAVYALVLGVQRLGGFRHDRFAWRATIPLVGLLLAAADWLYFHALAQPDVAISVASLMRRFSVVLTFVFGAVFFHEHNLRRKGVALALIVFGVILLSWR